ncbi:FAD-dependent oxidoreductase [Deinococcus humi]|uniref:NADPH-dependent 2,4-dienoyl-CoA reductase/sulfur reductase-like enzyme/nitrite reductase/ring-hydroxylating ferredoxin subunit n=1 Tax=Deinococcus humi TaxID=662880 RepID=A0A7W8JUU9_9DEIO|nr:FAD-dependent oxidoreductase [Deinococcus humi]MBB5363263.1 NADPH-dependent 2,4-dienoyl-CoA reductase/sulfur reductase-like enzyme/nitrite reductase/ring-hydroxylating ferredoxin subunit [Deinococcus humi]GGO27396.1 pyridine nucleotide-disulfide oxidoreductase [Deinococcus humi]
MSLKFKPGDVQDGGMHTFEVGDQKILVTRDGDDFRAFEGICPHAGANLGDGVRCGSRIVCPWHHATFHADNGSLIEPPALEGLKQYRVQRDGEDVSVDLNDEIKAQPPQPKHEGHHTVIIGGGASGFMAAQTLRDGGYAGRVTLLTAEHRAPYDRTALSKAYLSGKKPADGLPLGGADWAKHHQIDLREGTKVTEVDRAARTVHLDGEALGFDAVIVATGATPHTLDLPGAELDGQYQLRSLHDAQRLKAAAQDKDIVIIGSSFIGLEAASSLIEGARSVTVIGQDAEIMSRAVTPRVGRALRQLHQDQSVKFHLDAEVQAIEGSEKAEAVRLKSGERINADLILLGIGVSPNSDLLADLANQKGAVPVDAHLQAAPNVYAVGDIALAPTALGEMRVEHWRVALQEGMTAAQSILESPDLEPMNRRVPFFWTQQYGKSLRYVGHAASLDDTHIWGNPDELKFIEFAFKEGEAVAASGMGMDQDLAAFEELLRLGRAPGADEIRGGPFSLVERLKT